MTRDPDLRAALHALEQEMRDEAQRHNAEQEEWASNYPEYWEAGRARDRALKYADKLAVLLRERAPDVTGPAEPAGEAAAAAGAESTAALTKRRRCHAKHPTKEFTRCGRWLGHDGFHNEMCGGPQHAWAPDEGFAGLPDDHQGLAGLQEKEHAGVEAHPSLAGSGGRPEAVSPLAVFLELNGPEHPVARVAAFLRQDAMMQRTSPNHRWDVPETMARTYENAARILDEHLAVLKDRGGAPHEAGEAGCLSPTHRKRRKASR